MQHSVMLGTLRQHIPPEAEDPVLRSLLETELFHSPELRRYEWSRNYAAEEWLAQLRTASDHRQIGEERFGELERALGDGLGRLGGEFAVDYETRMLTAVRV
jgi:hypothetical protein